MQTETGQRVFFEFVKNVATAFPKDGEAFEDENGSLTNSGATYFVRVLLQSGFYLNLTSSYVIGPLAFVHMTQLVSSHPSASV